MNNKKLTYYVLAMVAFTSTFGFTNIAMNYIDLGLTAVSWWIIISVVYFIPLVMIMAELAIINKNEKGGIYSWVDSGLGANWAFFAAWSFFIANIFYLPMLASRVPIFAGWAMTGDTVAWMQSGWPAFIMTALVALAATLIAIVGPKLFARLGAITGTISLVAAAIFVIAAISAPFVTGQAPMTPIEPSAMMPDLSNLAFLSTFSWLIFAIAGAETVGPLISETENPQKNFPKGIILAAILIGGIYMLGTIGIAIVSTGEVFANLEAFGYTSNDVIFLTYQELANFYGWGTWFVQMMGWAYTFITIVALVIWSSANISVMFSSVKKGDLPNWLRKQNKNGVNVNALWFQFGLIMVFLFMIFGLSIGADVFYLMYDMSTMALLAPYIILVLAYIGYLRKNPNHVGMIFKNKTFGMAIAWLIFALTVIAFTFSAIDPTVPLTESMSSIVLYYGGFTIFMALGWVILKVSRSTHKKNK